LGETTERRQLPGKLTVTQDICLPFFCGGYLSLGELDYRQGADGGQDDPVGGIGTAPANGRNYLSRPAKPGHRTPPAFGMNLYGQGRR